MSRRYAKDMSAAKISCEAFIKAFKYIKKFDAEKGNLDAWLVRITINTAIDYNKKYGVNYDQGEYVINEGAKLQTAPQAISNLRVEEIVKLISTLPIGYQTVFNLFVIEQYNHAEIAEMLNIKEATSRSQLNKARKMLQKLLTMNENYRYEQRAI
ncbi:MAG: RNA polymerase sigma factor [Chitinophagales bacterium]